jgi:PKD repeat protein
MPSRRLRVGGSAATVVPSLVASRVSGTAPLAVHFDATASTSSAVGDAFRQVTYTFDYGDSGSGTWSTNSQSKNSDSGGPLGAHVYETAGTYTVTVTADDGTTSASTTVSITVSNPDTVYSGTNTICIDTTGGTTGGPSGCTYATSMPTIESNKRYLIKRGQTISGFTVPSTVTGVRIGAYGTGAKPVVDGAIYLNNNSTPTTAQWVEDVVVADLDVRNGIVQVMCGRHIALLRCTLDLAGSTATSILFADSLAYYSQSSGTGGDPGRVLARSDFYIPKYVFVVECYQRGVNTDVDQGLLHGIWGSVDCAAFMGNDSYTANQHLLRFYLARKALVQHCILADKSADGSRHAIKLHSGGLNPFLDAYESAAPAGTWVSSNNIIRYNTLGASDSNNAWTVNIAPQNTGSAEGVQDTILENNTFINSASKGVDIQAGPARRTTTRSNTLTGGSIRIGQNNNTYVEPIQSSWRGPYYGQFTG